MPITNAKQVNVLLIEDYPAHIQIMKGMLGYMTNPTFNLECADRLSAGLEILAGGNIDVVILDLSLPDSKGLDTFNRVHEQASHTPIVVMSALDDEVVAVEAVQAGAQDYLFKGGVDFNLLKRCILYAIERKRVENFIQTQRDLGITLSGVRDIKEALGMVIYAATKIEGMDCGGIYLVDPVSGAIELKYSKGLSEDFVEQVSFYEKDSERAKLIMKGEPVFTEYSELGVAPHDIDNLEKLRTIAVIPMLSHGRVIACMNVASHTQKTISSSGQHVLEALASQASNAISRLMIKDSLRESEERYRSLMENINMGITLIGSDYDIIMANSATGRMLDKDSGELVGKKCYNEFEKRKKICDHCPGTKAMATGLPQAVETEGVLDDGFHLPVLIRAFPVFDPENKPSGFVEIVEDITERKHAEKKLQDYQKKLRSLASELSLTEERERRHIATDLHDNIGQSLAISLIKLKEMQESATADDFVQPLADTRKLIEQTIRQTRSLMFELSPHMLYDLGFEAAVEWLTEQFQEQHKISYSFKDDRRPKHLGDDVRTLLFQAVRESLVNIAKHAQASHVDVSVQKDGIFIRIDITDNGVGFDTSRIGSNEDLTSGFGLFNIRERLDYLGGGFEIKSGPGLGTHVILSAPLKSDEATPEN